MISLLIAFAVLVIGYVVYSRITEKIFAIDGRKTPAVALNDGVDCVPMKTWKAFLVQLLNIAGTGPIFGALMGAVFGPVVFLWIVFGSLITALPATFMSAVSMTYILTASEGFCLATSIAYPVGIAFAATLFVLYIVLWARQNKKKETLCGLQSIIKEEGKIK